MVHSRSPADQALIAGAMARPFLAAPGEADGADAGLADAAGGYLHQAASVGTDIVLPSGLVAAPGYLTIWL